MRPVAGDSGRAGARLRSEVMPYLPETVRRALSEYLAGCRDTPREIRLRTGRPLHLVTSRGDVFLEVQITGADIKRGMELVTGCSVYAVEDHLREGFVTLPGGHRVGIAGTAVTAGGKLRTFRDISAMNYRVAFEMMGASGPVLPYLFSQDAEFLSTLILSPPNCGKTTFLRDVVRTLSDGDGISKAYRVCLVDERSEVAACHGGAARNSVGVRTDVLDGCPKAQGIMIGIRALSPEVVATDEIGRPEDAEAIFEAVTAGVRVVATAHAKSVDEAMERPSLGGVLLKGAFSRAVVLSDRFGPGTVEGVFEIPPRGVPEDVVSLAGRVDGTGRVLRHRNGDVVGVRQTCEGDHGVHPRHGEVRGGGMWGSQTACRRAGRSG